MIIKRRERKKEREETKEREREGDYYGNLSARDFLILFIFLHIWPNLPFKPLTIWSMGVKK